MSESYILYAILVMVAANYLTRVTPFLFFVKKEPPAFIVTIERAFPPIIMTILVFYSLKEIDFQSTPYGANELLSVAVTIFLHLSVKNYLVSIFAGTFCYMILIQMSLF